MLSTIKIPGTVTKIGEFAFYDTGLESVFFEADSVLTMISDSVSELRIRTYVYV